MVLISRLLSLLTLAALGAACLGSTPPVRLANPATVGVHLRLEGASGEDHPIPDDIQAAITEALIARNLQPTFIPAEAFSRSLTEVRTSPARFAALAVASPGTDHLLLVQASARYFNQIAGRFRWDVDARILFAPADATESPHQADLSVGAHLLFEHEREAEALSYVRRQILDDVGALLDRVLMGLPVDKAPTASRRADPPHRDALYFAMIDRFSRAASSGPPAHPDVDPADPLAWHGGDLPGLTEGLGWIRDLGVADLWISPPFATRGARYFGHGAFHAYWTEDLRAVEPRFGTADDLEALSAAAREAGLGLFLDLVLNHVGPETRLTRERPTWFRPAEAIDDWTDRRQLEEGQVHGLPDLDQDNPEVYAYLLDATRAWRDRLGLKGLRLDAVKHIGAPFWRAFNGSLRDETPALSLLGEILDGDPVLVEDLAREGRFTAIFDFGLHYALIDAICRDAGPGPLGSAISVNLALDDAARARGEAPLTRYAFLDNHDLPRARSLCGDDASVALALDALVTLPARPCLTWGTEVGLDGATEPDNRASMRFDAEHPLVARTRDALTRRATDRALTDGLTRLEAFDPRGALLFSRTADQSTVVAVNTSEVPLRVALPGRLDALGAELAVPPRAVLTLPLPTALPVDAAPATVQIAITGAPRGAVQLAGAGPALGGWRAEGALSADPDGRISLALPRGRLYAMKLLVRDGAETRWEERPNRYLFVDGPVSLTYRWGA